MNLKKKWPWLAAIACVLVAIAILHRRFSAPEPAYKGKTLTAWFKLAAQQDPTAVDMFHQLGPAGVPFLAEELRRGDSRWQQFYYREYPKLPAWVRAHISEPPPKQTFAAARLLGELGPAAEPAFGDMLLVYNHSYLNQFGLPRHGDVDWNAQLTNPPRWVPPTNASSDFLMRRWLLIGFCNLQGAHKESVPLLLASLHEPGLFGTFWIINSTNLDASVRLAEPTLLAALTDPEPGVGASAAKLLGTLAPDHPEVIGPLMKAAEDPVATVRLNALQSLAKAPVPFEQMLVVATKAFDDREPTVRNQAMTTLMRNAGGYRALDSNLAAALDNNDPAVRAAGATLLGRFGVKSKHAVPKLTQLTLETNEPDEHVRQQAGIALSKITPSPAGK